jgi:alanyl-tRNA synthetase
MAQVEREVNDFIRQNAPVETRIMTPDDARGIGAQALFGEKYGDEVRVVSMGTLGGSGKGRDGETYSLELCGGTHVRQTGDIGLVRGLGDSASSAGVRRIEALTDAARQHLTEQDEKLRQAASLLKVQPGDVPSRIEALMDERRKLERELTEARKKLALGGGGAAGGDESLDIGGVKYLGKVVTGVAPKELKGLVDAAKASLGSGVAAFVAVSEDGKASVVVGVTEDLTSRLSAVDLVRAASEAIGGKGGGGRPDMAQAGGPDGVNANAAIDAVAAALS